MTVTVYRSTDISAPVLTGETSKLIDLLHACLVTGYGSKPAAGWSRAYFDDPNDTAAFRQGAGSQFYLRVDDGGPGAGTFKEARAVGYESMSDVNTGVAPFPTVAQAANGVFIRKSAAADSTARAWILVATAKLFHLFVFTGDTANVASAFSFGDVYSYKSADAYSCHISGRATENAILASGETVGTLVSTVTATTAGHYIARSYTGIGGSVLVGQHSDYWTANQTQVGASGGLAYPNPVDGAMQMTPLYLNEAAAARGTVPGLWNPMHVTAFGLGDTISGVGGLSGRVFEVVSVTVASSQLLLETSDTWTEN